MIPKMERVDPAFERFSRIIIPARVRTGSVLRKYKIKVLFENGRLSMVGETPGFYGQSRDVLCQGSTVPVDGVSYTQVARIYAIWERYHLNDMNAGTPRQMEFLRQNRKEGVARTYESDCKALEDAGLLVDEGYRYGTEWKFEEVPEDVLRFLFSFNPGEGSSWEDVEDYLHPTQSNVNLDELLRLVSS